MRKIKIITEIIVHTILIVGMILGIQVFNYTIEDEIEEAIADFDILFDNESGKTIEDKMTELGVSKGWIIGYYVENDNEPFQSLDYEQRERIFNELKISKEYRDSIEKISYNKYYSKEYRITYYLEKGDVNVQMLQDIFPEIDFSNGVDMQLRKGISFFITHSMHPHIYFYVKDKENTIITLEHKYIFE